MAKKFVGKVIEGWVCIDSDGNLADQVVYESRSACRGMTSYYRECGYKFSTYKAKLVILPDRKKK